MLSVVKMTADNITQHNSKSDVLRRRARLVSHWLVDHRPRIAVDRNARAKSWTSRGTTLRFDRSATSGMVRVQWVENRNQGIVDGVYLSGVPPFGMNGSVTTTEPSMGWNSAVSRQ